MYATLMLERQEMPTKELGETNQVRLGMKPSCVRRLRVYGLAVSH